MRLLTVGHSARPLEEFLALLLSHGVGALCDVRAFPTSRRLPHFGRDLLEPALSDADIDYCWLGRDLGGYRKRSREHSPHVALDQQGFRNYADHMESESFHRGVAQLLGFALAKPTAVMCAEKDWRRCHRQHLADHLVALEGIEVRHILDESEPEPHRLDARARVAGQRLVYDVGGQQTLF